eukprot:5290787-Pyramimonas_sp.AAC.1
MGHCAYEWYAASGACLWAVASASAVRPSSGDVRDHNGVAKWISSASHSHRFMMTIDALQRGRHWFLHRRRQHVDLWREMEAHRGSWWTELGPPDQMCESSSDCEGESSS